MWSGSEERLDILPQQIPEIIHTDENDVTDWPEPPRPLDCFDDSVIGDVKRLVSPLSSSSSSSSENFLKWPKYEKYC